MKHLRISISPELRTLAGPSIDWAWRQLLTTIGYGWQEVPFTDACDITYVIQAVPASQARIVILASPQFWQKPAAQRLANLAVDDPHSSLRYIGESFSPDRKSVV